MNQHLLKAIAIALLYGVALMPQRAAAQCLCEGGVAPTPLEYLVVLDTITTSSTPISFPRFDPDIGTLICVKLDDTVSVVSTLGIKNQDSKDVEYSFVLTVITNVSGPSMGRTDPATTSYGPDTLRMYGNPGDSINYGPDTLFKNKPSTMTNTGNMAPYLGVGNVNFVYSISGGTIAIGGASFDARIRTTSWGVFKLTYYWCEASPLANNIKDFSAVLDNELVRLQWMVHNDEPSYQYQIQTSYDGKSFQTVGSPGGKDITYGAAAKYQYQFHPGASPDGKLYFRIAQSDGDIVRYSAVRVLNLKGSVPALKIYPNPATGNVNMQFGTPVSGNFLVELSNQVGQVVHSQRLNLQHAGQLSLVLRDPPPGGIYFLRAREEQTGRIFSGKLLLRRP